MKALDVFLNDGVPSPDSNESLESFLRRLDLLDQGFSYRELVTGSRKKAMPPRKEWASFALILRVAIAFREGAIREAGVKGLKVAAACRKRGGASRSAHKYSRALDLDRIGGSSTDYFRYAARFWADHGPKCGMGLGLYTWGSKSLGGIRVHLDADHFAGLRTWQGIRTRFGRPWGGKALTYHLLDLQGIPYPRKGVRS